MENLENKNNNDNVVEDENNNENIVEIKETTVDIVEAEDTPEAVVEAEETTVDIVEAEDTPEVVVEAEDTPEAVVEELVVQSAYDDFDWDKGPKGVLNYSNSEIEEFEQMYNTTLNSIKEYEIVAGKVVFITESDIVLDLNCKSDGLVSRTEFRDMPDLGIGDVVEVYVETQEDKRGQLVLSRRKAKLLNAWANIVESHASGRVVSGTVISKTKGGLIVDVEGLETFLPGSQIDIRPIIDYDAFVGKTMDFKVVKINESIKNAVVSHKALIESDLEEQRQAIISKLEKGQVLEGTVKNLTDFGAFLDLGGVDGLLYITDISWGRIKHPSDVLENGQKLNVVVLDFNDDKKRISLGLKQLQSHPWDVLEGDLIPGSVVKGKIVNIEDYGAFLEVTPGVEGLIHVSEVSWSSQPINSREFFKEGDEYEAKIVTIDRDERKMSLSLRKLQEDPWSQIEEKYPKGSEHTGEVKNLTPYGVFIELEEGIGGMIHISDLSWTKRFAHPAEFTKVGANLDIIILEIDKESRKLSLGHKQLEENPWDTFAGVFPEGSLHEATILRRDDRGAIVLLPYGLEAFAPIRHIKKEDGALAEVDEQLIFKVIEFNRDDKRILVSHSRYYTDAKREAEQADKDAAKAEKKTAQKTMKKVNAKTEKSTFGDLSAFSELKEQLKNDTEEVKAKKTKETAVEKVEEEVKVEAVEESSEPVQHSEASLTKLKKAELIEMAKEKGVSTSGTKSDLVSAILGA
ncbi:MAG: 30S ribosomal protein S1 [Saprospiraceae bacterium]|nr:30S ribosomal protein S1 [Saprospiraceae bacterium]